MRPRLGFNPTSPHHPAGRRTEPPMSVPTWSGPYPAAPAAPAPALDPPGFFVRSHGLRVSGWKLDTPDEVMPRSGIVVFEKMIAPASRNRAGTGESCAAGVSGSATVPSGVGTPFEEMFSFTVTGTPSSGPSGAPLAQRPVEAIASVRALSGSYEYSALRCGSQRAMWLSTAAKTSDGDNDFAR